MDGIVHIAGFGNVADDVLCNHRAGLIAQRVDAGTVVHVLGVVVYQVGVNLVVLHAYQITVPAPTQRDACIGYVVNGVVLDVDARDIACGDGYTAPVLVGDVVELAVAYLLLGTNISEVSRLVGEVSLQSCR